MGGGATFKINSHTKFGCVSSICLGDGIRTEGITISPIRFLNKRGENKTDTHFRYFDLGMSVCCYTGRY